MLREALTWLATPCAPAARRIGYLGAAIGLESRARRCRAVWAEHLRHCRRAVTQSLTHCTRHRTALILGAGLALEYPLAELSAQFRRVILTDIVHLPTLRRQARRHANVELAACDLTGLTDAVAALRRDATATDLAALVAAQPRLDVGEVDWVLSSNVLSQLPLLPATWLRRRCARLSDDALECWGRAIMARHLSWLAALDAERCLIADAAQTTRDRAGRILEHADIAAAFDLDRHAYATWDWTIAPQGELPDGLSACHRVVACRWPSSR